MYKQSAMTGVALGLLYPLSAENRAIGSYASENHVRIACIV
jgi:hypothetical protein